MNAAHVTTPPPVWIKVIGSLLGILLCWSHTFSADFTGPVVRVLDDDTIDVSRNHRNVRIRLNGIDAPVGGTHQETLEQTTQSSP